MVTIRKMARLNWTLTLPALDIFANILKHLKTVIEQRLSEAHGEHFTKRSIQWVLTVPAMWRASARDFMRQAVIKVSNVLYTRSFNMEQSCLLCVNKSTE